MDKKFWAFACLIGLSFSPVSFAGELPGSNSKDQIDATDFNYSPKIDMLAILTRFLNRIDEQMLNRNGRTVETACGYLPLKENYDPKFKPYLDKSIGRDGEGACVVPLLSDGSRKYLSPEHSAVDWGLYFEGFIRLVAREQEVRNEIEVLRKRNAEYLEFFKQQQSAPTTTMPGYPPVYQQGVSHTNEIAQQYKDEKVDESLTKKMNELIQLKQDQIATIKWSGVDIYWNRGIDYPVVYKKGPNGDSQFIVFLPIPRIQNNSAGIKRIKNRFEPEAWYNLFSDWMRGSRNMMTTVGGAMSRMSSDMSTMVEQLSTMSAAVEAMSADMKHLPQMTQDVSSLVNRLEKMNQAVSGLNRNVGKMQAGMNPMGMMMSMFGM